METVNEALVCHHLLFYTWVSIKCFNATLLVFWMFKSKSGSWRVIWTCIWVSFKDGFGLLESCFVGRVLSFIWFDKYFFREML